MTFQYERSVSCLRCGVLIAWRWTEGDKHSPTAHLNRLFDIIAAHQNMKRGHAVRFKVRVFEITSKKAPGTTSDPASDS